jgi:hypothetical protein
MRVGGKCGASPTTRQTTAKTTHLQQGRPVGAHFGFPSLTSDSLENLRNPSTGRVGVQCRNQQMVACAIAWPDFSYAPVPIQ